MSIDYYNIIPNDNKVFNELSIGRTKGIFQVDSNLGHAFTKSLKPTTIEHLSALGAILRPGCLECKIPVKDGKEKSVTQLYCDRKNHTEEITETISKCEDILDKSYGLMIYQEQLLAIAQRVAGFSLEEADKLRKAVGQKKVDLMNATESMFIEGVKKTKLISEEDGKNIFEMMRKSQRYLFNHCITSDTVVETKNGYKTISDLDIGEEVACPTDDFNNKTYTKVIDKFDTGIQKVYELTLESGKKIKCTLLHKFLCDDGEIRPLTEILSFCYKIGCESNKVYFIQFEKIIHLKEIGDLPTVDITVDNNHHLYYANSIITSNSHSYLYAMIGYWSAFCKTYYTTEFFCAWLEYAKDKMNPKQEIKELVNEMKNYSINLKIPNIIHLLKTKEYSFFIEGKDIYFGLNSIKGIGDNQIKNLISELEKVCTLTGKNIENICWHEILFLTNINKTTLTNLISVGVFDNFKINRKEMLHELNLSHKLTNREKIILNQICKPFKQGIEYILSLSKKDGGPFNESRKEILSSILDGLINPPFSIKDDSRWIYESEQELLGCNITCSKLDSRDVTLGDTTCKEFNDGKTGKMIINLEISSVREYTIKKGESVGKKMGFFVGSDNTGKVDCMIFDENWENNKDIIYAGNTIVVIGTKSKKDTFIVEKVLEI